MLELSLKSDNVQEIIMQSLRSSLKDKIKISPKNFENRIVEMA